MVLNGDTGELLAMVEGRSKAALSRFFIEQGPRWCQNVKTVVTDGSHSYRAAVQRYLPRARHVLDRFHAVRWFAQGLTLVRRELQRRQPTGVKPAFHPDLFRARFCLLRRNDHLTAADRKRLERLFAAHRVFGWPGTLSKSSTASIRPTTSKAPWTLFNASPTSTKPARFPSTTTP